MRRAALVLFLTALGCASSSSKTAHAEPEVEILQVSTVAEAARNVTGAIPIQYVVQIHNTTTTSLQLKHIEIQSVTSGAYTLEPLSRTYDQRIEAGETVNFDLWGSADASGTITGANGPVTIRAIAQFDSPTGSFQTVGIKQVRADGLGVR
jgi:hypothetical protein